jgi:hypothetical protein
MLLGSAEPPVAHPQREREWAPQAALWGCCSLGILRLVPHGPLQLLRPALTGPWSSSRAPVGCTLSAAPHCTTNTGIMCAACPGTALSTPSCRRRECRAPAAPLLSPIMPPPPNRVCPQRAAWEHILPPFTSARAWPGARAPRPTTPGAGPRRAPPGPAAHLPSAKPSSASTTSSAPT